ncbi:MAG: hypothetical protein HQL55_18080 [Magnetococcales bacterium]|nr:hypothetical protein [Magnetococcales bacterium]
MNGSEQNQSAVDMEAEVMQAKRKTYVSPTVTHLMQVGLTSGVKSTSSTEAGPFGS